jgi:hypothetical protein
LSIKFGDWGLGIGDWGLGIGPNPQSPIPNPQIFLMDLLKLKSHNKVKDLISIIYIIKIIFISFLFIFKTY